VPDVQKCDKLAVTDLPVADNHTAHEKGYRSELMKPSIYSKTTYATYLPY